MTLDQQVHQNDVKLKATEREIKRLREEMNIANQALRLLQQSVVQLTEIITGKKL